MKREQLLRILDLARWAPSGDNTQPWRFEIVADDRIAVHGHDTREWCLYDFDGHASHMAHGALLETLRIAATAFGLKASWQLRRGCSDTEPVYEVHLRDDPGHPVDPLFPCIEKRSVQRRPMRTRPLTDAQRQALRDAAGEGYTLHFAESPAERLRVAGLLWDNAYIRLTCPEAFAVHREIIEWGARYSKDRIPERAVGVDRLTAKLMRWAMQRWERVDFFNRYLLGTVLPRLQLDVVPALACAGHVLLGAVRPPANLADYVLAGMAMQRLWLTATFLGLCLQPEMTPIIFHWYVRAGRAISAVPEIVLRSHRLDSRFAATFSAAAAGEAMFLCRLGYSAPPFSRSLRRDLDELMLSG